MGKYCQRGRPVVQCPKEKQITLAAGLLSGDLVAQCCPNCQGHWISSEVYSTWQEKHPPTESEPVLIDRLLETTCEPAPLDSKAALCPECNAYLARARVSLKTPFYVERCPNCKGIWCDRGEWDVLEKQGLAGLIPRLFATDWQTLVRERELAAQERRATIDKLGPELADRIFALAEALENHPYGDFGVAYLMRRFDR